MKKCKKKCEKKKEKKREECTVDYCCNPQCIGCGGTVISPHPLVVCIIRSDEGERGKKKTLKAY